MEHQHQHLHHHSDPGSVALDGAPKVAGRLHPLSMVYGGGGVYGIAYNLGVAHGMVAAGLPVAAAPSLGTSAGSWSAAVMALGLGYEEVDALEAPSVPWTAHGRARRHRPRPVR